MVVEVLTHAVRDGVQCIEQEVRVHLRREVTQAGLTELRGEMHRAQLVGGIDWGLSGYAL